jgi:hypothetical protein
MPLCRWQCVPFDPTNSVSSDKRRPSISRSLAQNVSSTKRSALPSRGSRRPRRLELILSIEAKTCPRPRPLSNATASTTAKGDALGRVGDDTVVSHASRQDATRQLRSPHGRPIGGWCASPLYVLLGLASVLDVHSGPRRAEVPMGGRTRHRYGVSSRLCGVRTYERPNTGDSSFPIRTLRESAAG